MSLIFYYLADFKHKLRIQSNSIKPFSKVFLINNSNSLPEEDNQYNFTNDDGEPLSFQIYKGV